MSFRLLSETTGAAEIDNLMSGAGGLSLDGEYGADSDIYLTYSFYRNGSLFGYIDNYFPFLCFFRRCKGNEHHGKRSRESIFRTNRKIY